MSRTVLDSDIYYGIDRLFEEVWESAERQGIPWQDVDKAFQRHSLGGFDEWWKEGEE